MTRHQNSVDSVRRAPSGPRPCHFSWSIREPPASPLPFRRESAVGKAQTQTLPPPGSSQISWERGLEEPLERKKGGTERCHNSPVSVAPPHVGSLVVPQYHLPPPSPDAASPLVDTTRRSPRGQATGRTKALAHSSSRAREEASRCHRTGMTRPQWTRPQLQSPGRQMPDLSHSALGWFAAQQWVSNHLLR